MVDAEWAILYEKLEKIVSSGAKVVLSKLPIGDVATQYFADRCVCVSVNHRRVCPSPLLQPHPFSLFLPPSLPPPQGCLLCWEGTRGGPAQDHAGLRGGHPDIRLRPL